MNKTKLGVAVLAAVLALAAPLTLAACGSGDDSSGEGNSTDRAFVAAMIPHHEGAIEMAAVARENGQRRFVRALADDITSAQAKEIRLMRSVDAQLADDGVETGDLGMSEHMMGMQPDMAALHSARPFDRAFIAMMVPHHEGAIRMARVEIAEGENARLVALAHRIVRAQSHEIEAMDEFHSEHYGEPVSGGGHGGGSMHGSMGHSG